MTKKVRKLKRGNPATAIVATGPSLTKDPKLVDYIKKYYQDIICVSNSYEFFKDDAKALVSSDGRWWDEYQPKIDCDKYCLTNPSSYKLTKDEKTFGKVSTQTNSGCFALIVARTIYKPKHIHLYGFDMNNKNGDHYFGPHKNLKNTTEKRFDIFQKQFDQEAKELEKEGIVCLNFSEDSSLEQFTKVGILGYDI